MRIVGWICQGDTAACGAVVLDGIPESDARGRPVSYVGARMSCDHRCVIAEGQSTMNMRGKTLALNGHKTTKGCPLTSQLNHQTGHGDVSEALMHTDYCRDAARQWVPKTFDESIQFKSAEGIPLGGMYYRILMEDGSQHAGVTDKQGYTRRIETAGKLRMIRAQLSPDGPVSGDLGGE